MRQLRFVLAWAEIYQNELEENWQRVPPRCYRPYMRVRQMDQVERLVTDQVRRERIDRHLERNIWIKPPSLPQYSPWSS